MSVLLDTHLLLWSAFQPARLPLRAREVIEGGERALWFSAASIWEVAIKRSLDRPDFRVDPGVLRAGLLANGYRELPIEGRHCLTLAALPAHHADPFDRMLVAQAISEGMVLMTADDKVARYGGPVERV